MSLILNVSALAVRPLAQAICGPAWDNISGAADVALERLGRHFVDHSDRLIQAVRQANDRAWQSLEIALAGDSFRDRVRLFLASADDQAIRRSVESFLDSTPLPDLAGKKDFRQKCIHELHQARRAGLLTEGNLTVTELARLAGQFARFADQQALLRAEWNLLQSSAMELQQSGYPNLGWLLAQQPQDNLPLLIVAARFFIGRAVETDAELFRGLTFHYLQDLSVEQQSGFQSLHTILTHQRERLDQLLGEVLSVAIETRDAVFDLRVEFDQQMRGLGQQFQPLYQAVQRLLEQFELNNRPLRPRDSLSIRSKREREMVHELSSRYHNLPGSQQNQMPSLLYGLGKLGVAVGNFKEAEADFLKVATITTDPRAQAEAHYSAYRTALERQDWGVALSELCKAGQLDPGRHDPFPFEKYVPIRILGAGGFGVAFQCRHQFSKMNLVIKALTEDELDRDIDDVFVEAQALVQLDHHAIVRFHDCGYTDPSSRSRPFLVMEFFDGLTLEEHVKQHGPLKPEELAVIGRSIAEALQAAHTCNILHRDVKPANVLIRRKADSAASWEVKLIDFGLALRTTTVDNALNSISSGEKSLISSSIAGTLDYAAPEQMGKLPGVPVGRYSDVFGFGKMCYYTLLGTPDPDDDEKANLPDAWRKLLSQCTARVVEKRPPGFGHIVEQLASLRTAITPAERPWFESQPSIQLAPRVPPKTIQQPTPPEKLPAGWTAVGSLAVRMEALFDRITPYPAEDDPNAQVMLQLEVKRRKDSSFQGVTADIMLVLDTSRSMNQPERYPLLRKAVAEFLRCMEPDDRVGIVLFSTSSDLVMKLHKGELACKSLAINQIITRMDQSPSLFHGRQTLLAPALESAYKVLETGNTQHSIRRVYILTDGELHDARECAEPLSVLRQAGIEVNSYGFGTDFNAVSLKEMLAGQLGGSVKPICDEKDVVNTFAHIAEVNKRLVARQAKITVNFAKLACQGAWTFRPQERYLGQISNRQVIHEFGGLEESRTYSLLFEVQLPYEKARQTPVAEAVLSWLEGDRETSTRYKIQVTRDSELDPIFDLPTVNEDVNRAYTVLVALRHPDDKSAELAAARARLELARLENRDPDLIDALETKLALLEGVANLDQYDDDYLTHVDAYSDSDFDSHVMLDMNDDDDLSLTDSDDDIGIVLPDDDDPFDFPSKSKK